MSNMWFNVTSTKTIVEFCIVLRLEPTTFCTVGLCLNRSTSTFILLVSHLPLHSKLKSNFQPRWRNRLARCTYNAEVVSSSLTRGINFNLTKLFFATGVLFRAFRIKNVTAASRDRTSDL